MIPSFLRLRWHPGFPLPAFLLLSLYSLCLCGASRGAGLDPQVDKPYRLRVVLGLGEHRLLTPVFQDQVERELGESLQAALGDLAVVEVTRQHPRLKEVQRDGLQQALDAWKDVDDVKTHFVLLNYVNGEYEIQARQHDGLTGQSSDVVRRVRLADADRLLVTRVAALLVGEDFGIVGTVTGKLDPTNDTVPVTLKGSKLNEALDRRIKPDDVLALVQLSAASGGMRATRVIDALLRVQRGPDNGVCVCQLHHRYKDPASSLEEGRGILGYRCLKLSTGRAPLRLRLVQANGRGAAVPSQRVDFRHQGFSGEDLTKVQGATDADGYFSTEKAGDRGLFDGVAFVTVISVKTAFAQIPVPIYPDGRTVTIPLNVNPAGGAQQLTFRRDLWIGQTYDSLRALVDLFKELEVLLKERKRDEALTRAQAGLAGVKEDVTRFVQQRDELMKDAHGVDLKLGNGDQAVQQLRGLQDKLQNVVAKLEKGAKEEKDPKRLELQGKVSQAQLLEDQAEFGKALELYEQVLAAVPDDGELRKKYDKLKADWQPKDDKHKQARDFIYTTWPGLDPLKLLSRLEEAQRAFQVCKQAGDRLGPQKLLAATVEHATKLQEKFNALKPDDSDDDRATAKVIADVSEHLKTFIKELGTFLEGK
jgi:tetratricopeptide (TPR) repeat protein